MSNSAVSSMTTTRRSGGSSFSWALTNVVLPAAVEPTTTHRISCAISERSEHRLQDRWEHVEPDEVGQADLAEGVAAQRERDVLGDVAGGGQPQTVAQPHHQEWVLCVELPLGATLRASDERQPLEHFALRRPRRALQRHHPTVGVVREEPIEP